MRISDWSSDVCSSDLDGAAPSTCLDLNQVTIVPGGSNVPYMLYLARGRDQAKPACVVLVDGDTAGETARKQIKKGGAHGKPTVARSEERREGKECVSTCICRGSPINEKKKI